MVTGELVPCSQLLWSSCRRQAILGDCASYVASINKLQHCRKTVTHLVSLKQDDKTSDLESRYIDIYIQSCSGLGLVSGKPLRLRCRICCVLKSNSSNSDLPCGMLFVNMHADCAVLACTACAL